MKNWNGGFISASAGVGGGSGKVVLESEDLEEEEVGDMVKAREGSKTRSNSTVRGSSSSAWRFKANKPRSVPRAAADGGGRQDFAAVEWVEPQQSSSVPADWSKILKKRSEKEIWDDDACDADSDDACDGDDDHGKVDEVENDDDDDDGEMVPPHEYLARRFANSQIASHSMCEGVGRTLKGRDLSKLRNAILTKTGFIE